MGFGLTDADKTIETIEKAVESLNGESKKPPIEKREEDGFTYWTRSDAAVEAGRQRRRRRREGRNAKKDAEQKEAEESQREIRDSSTRQPRGVLGVIGESLVFCDSPAAFEVAVATYQGAVSYTHLTLPTTPYV